MVIGPSLRSNLRSLVGTSLYLGGSRASGVPFAEPSFLRYPVALALRKRQYLDTPCVVVRILPRVPVVLADRRPPDRASQKSCCRSPSTRTQERSVLFER